MISGRIPSAGQELTIPGLSAREERMPEFAVLIYANDSLHAPDATKEELKECDEHLRRPCRQWSYAHRVCAHAA